MFTQKQKRCFTVSLTTGKYYWNPLNLYFYLVHQGCVQERKSLFAWWPQKPSFMAHIWVLCFTWYSLVRKYKYRTTKSCKRHFHKIISIELKYSVPLPLKTHNVLYSQGGWESTYIPRISKLVETLKFEPLSASSWDLLPVVQSQHSRPTGGLFTSV